MTTPDFVFELPSKIDYGIGAIDRLGEHLQQLGCRRVLVVSDAGLLGTGIVDQVSERIHKGGFDHTLFTDVEPEPDVSGIDRGVDAFKANDCDAIVAVGGGSVLDTAKAISVMARNPGQIGDYAGLGKVSEPGVPMIALPTTAGTGSEATIWAVISEKSKGVKYGVGSPHMTADVALCDPALSVSLPSRLTAVTGLDALAHALESYVNKATHPISEALSERAMSLVAGALRDAVTGGDRLSARADMLLASTMAAMAFNSTRLGLAHALAMPLGAEAKIPHGDVVSILLPPVMRYNAVGNVEKFARIAEIFGQPTEGISRRDAADLGVSAVEQLARDVGAPSRLADYGVKESDLASLAESAMTSGNIAVNPRAATTDDLVEIMRSCL